MSIKPDYIEAFFAGEVIDEKIVIEPCFETYIQTVLQQTDDFDENGFYQNLSDNFGQTLRPLWLYLDEGDIETAKAILWQMLEFIQTELNDWRVKKDPKLRKLHICFDVISFLGSDRQIWKNIWENSGNNAELISALEYLVGYPSFEVSYNRDATATSTHIFYDSIIQADIDCDFAALCPKLPYFFSKPIFVPRLIQATIGLYMMDERRLIGALDKVNRTIMISSMCRGLNHKERLSIASKIHNTSFVFLSLFEMMNDLSIANISEKLLTKVILQGFAVRDDPMPLLKAYNTYIFNNAKFQKSLSVALVAAGMDVVKAFVTSLDLHADDSEDRRKQVAQHFKYIHESMEKEQRKLIWAFSFEKWKIWNFSTNWNAAQLSRITHTQLDYALVGYYIECLNEEGREEVYQAVIQKWDRIGLQWYESQADLTAEVFGTLSALQPICHAREIVDQGGDYLQTNRLYELNYGEHAEYFKLKYSRK